MRGAHVPAPGAAAGGGPAHRRIGRRQAAERADRGAHLVQVRPPRHHRRRAVHLDAPFQQAALGEHAASPGRPGRPRPRAQVHPARLGAVEVLVELPGPLAADQQPVRVVRRMAVQEADAPGRSARRCRGRAAGSAAAGWAAMSWRTSTASSTSVTGGRSSSKPTTCSAMASSLGGCGGTTSVTPDGQRRGPPDEVHVLEAALDHVGEHAVPARARARRRRARTRCRRPWPDHRSTPWRPGPDSTRSSATGENSGSGRLGPDRHQRGRAARCAAPGTRSAGRSRGGAAGRRRGRG